MRLLRGEIDAAGIAPVILILQNPEHAVAVIDKRMGCFYLGVDRSLLDRGHHHIGDQGVVGCSHLITRDILLGLERLHGAPVEPEHVRHVRDATPAA